MSTLTLGTNATTSLTALPWSPGIGGNGGVSAADYAAINALIRPDSSVTFAQTAEQFRLDPSGILYLPKKRGHIRLLAGDYIGIDNKGWPIVVSAYSIANGAWTHS